MRLWCIRRALTRAGLMPRVVLLMRALEMSNDVNVLRDIYGMFIVLYVVHYSKHTKIPHS
jgi:lipid-A-disaccharide synthase-like uncharacterized protein